MARKKREAGPVVSLMRPRDPEVSVRIGQQYASSGKAPNLNEGLWSAKQYRDRYEEIAAAKEAGKTPPPDPNLYDPIIVQIGRSQNARFAIAGSGKATGSTPPSDWPSMLPKWQAGDRLTSFRLFHEPDVSKNVYEDALVKVGEDNFIVGFTDEGGEFLPAPFCVWASDNGSYSYIHETLKELGYMDKDGVILLTTESGSAVSKTDFTTLVGMINSDFGVVDLEDGNQLPVAPGNIVTWGHLIRDGKALTAAQIRKVGDDTSGITWEPLKERWVSPIVFKDKLVREVKNRMSRATTKNEKGETAWERFVKAKRRSVENPKKQNSPEDCIYINVGTISRGRPLKPYCYGLRYVMIGQAVGRKFNDQGKEGFIVLLGGHLPVGLTETARGYKARMATPETPEVEVTGEAKPKAKNPKAADTSPEKSSEKKSKPKTKKPKGKDKKPKVEPVTAEVVDASNEKPEVDTSAEKSEEVKKPKAKKSKGKKPKAEPVAAEPVESELPETEPVESEPVESELPETEAVTPEAEAEPESTTTELSEAIEPEALNTKLLSTRRALSSRIRFFVDGEPVASDESEPVE